LAGGVMTVSIRRVSKCGNSLSYRSAVRPTCWSLGAAILVSVLLTLSCGGGDPQPPVIEVSVSPQTAQVLTGGMVQFSGKVTGSRNLTLTWSVNGVGGGNAAVGTIDATGLYTAPAVPPAPNTVTVKAVSIVDPTQSGTASATIVNPAPTISSIAPSTVFASSGDPQLTVTGSGFTPQSTLTANGSAVPATLVGSTQLAATLPVQMLAQPAVLNIVVSNPAPGVGTSSSVALTVLAQGSVSPTANPQVALYSFGSPRDASVSIEFGTDTTYGLHTWAQDTPPGGGTVEILVAGMRANTTYHMRADVNFPDGTQFFDTDHTFTTGGLPAARVPQVTVTEPSGLSPSGGVEMLHLSPGNSQVQIAAVDNNGNLIWYYDVPAGFVPEPIKLLPNGHILVNLNTTSTLGTNAVGDVREIDLAGNVVRDFTVDDLNHALTVAGFSLQVSSIHHDLVQLPNGHLILLVNRNKVFTDLPGYPGTTLVLGDALVDLDENLTPVWVWDTFDHLDVNRHPMLFPDWTHSNAVLYSADDGNLILSMRHQSWVIKIDYQDGRGSGDIVWRLGYQGDFTLTNGGPQDWFFAEHYPAYASPNTTGVFKFIVFDNGDNRVLDASGDVCGTPGQIACYSRIPIFQIDELGKTATLLWEYNAQPVYSFWGGSAQQLDNGNVVFGITTPSDDPTGARYMEVTHDPVPQVVLRMEISGQNAYRAVHLPSLYPGVQW